jgi:hypothetical protein
MWFAITAFVEIMFCYFTIPIIIVICEDWMVLSVFKCLINSIVYGVEAAVISILKELFPIEIPTPSFKSGDVY